MKTYKHIVLAYSGGLDTSTALHYLKKRFECRVTAYCANVGQKEDWAALEKRALAAGADALYVDDLRQHFIQDFVFPALKANATYERDYLLGTPLARPAIVEGMIEYAHAHGGDALAHGCTPKGNDQARFELSALLLDRELPTIAPWRIWDLSSREDMLEYCERNAIPIEHSKKDLFSHDENLVHVTTEGDYLEDIENPFRWEHTMWVVPPTKAPDRVEKVTISFERGEPVAVDGVRLSAIELMERLNAVGGANGVGLQDIVENRMNGMKVRGVFENPALYILHQAHRLLEDATMSGEVARVRDALSPHYGDIVYRGLWFSPERIAIQKLVDFSQEHVTGHVRIELYKGSCFVSGVKSATSLYARDLVTLHRGVEFSADDATGFLRTMALPYRQEMERGAAASPELPAIPEEWSK